LTFCLGIKVKEGLVGIADTRVMSGSEFITARKLFTYEKQRHSMFVMTSGLRSVCDKALTYFNEVMDEREEPFDRLFKAANAFAMQIRRVADEDGDALSRGGLSFNVNALIGGQLTNDREHKLYLLYPEGNWVEVGEGTPYHIIGAPGYGKPVLVRALKYHDSLRFALKIGCLAFDSTRVSAADVDFPIDVALYARDTYRIAEHRYDYDDLRKISDWWQDRIRASVNELSEEWIEGVFSKLITSQ
jgi:putative proteasome-type protease